jgi:hypothetical protein
MKARRLTATGISLELDVKPKSSGTYPHVIEVPIDASTMKKSAHWQISIFPDDFKHLAKLMMKADRDAATAAFGNAMQLKQKRT